jgi:Domain of unknown function (DUF4839)
MRVLRFVVPLGAVLCLVGCDSDKQAALPSAIFDSPSATGTAEQGSPVGLTAQNNAEFAALLKVGDYCSSKVSRFAKKYAGQRVEFEGSIAAMGAHEGARTRFDILVGPGDKGVNTSSGPAFQFFDKNAFDLNLTGPNIPDSIETGQKYTFIAEIDEYIPDSCLLRLTPIETQVR